MSLPVPWLPTGARSLPQAADPAIGKVVVIGEVAVQGWSLSAGKGDGGGGGQGGAGRSLVDQCPELGSPTSEAQP